jgi:hypothetical protein
MGAKASSGETGLSYPLVCLRIDLAGHSTLQDAECTRHNLKERLRDRISGIIVAHGGRDFTWEGDGGAYLFAVTDGHEFDESVLAAFRILGSLPGINEELRSTAGLVRDLSVRISLDSGQSILDANTGRFAGGFLGAFLENEGAMSSVDAMTMTERVHGHLSEPLQGRFAEIQRSDELGCRVYRMVNDDAKAASGLTAMVREPPPHPTAAPTYSVFLAYAGADGPVVEEIARRLKREGIRPWLDTWNLIPGEPWQPEIERVLMGCDAAAVFIGPGPIGPWQHEEMRAAIARQVEDRRSGNKFRVIPVHLPGDGSADLGRLPPFLRNYTRVVFRETLADPEAFRRLICGIKGLPPHPPDA